MASFVDIDSTVAQAAAAAPRWASSTAADRAALLVALAQALEEQGEALVALANTETHLGLGRLQGELARTCFQLRGFAQQVEAGAPFVTTNSPAVAGPPPAGRPDLLQVRVPLGPVAMFSASNFPFAFSVLGGDTASALAAGCPVVIKAHPAHPRLSRSVHALACRVITERQLPTGLMGHIEGDDHDTSVHLVRHPDIQAVAFTGSLAGGVALNQHAQSRPQPIPFYGELGSINPVVILQNALESALDEKASTLVTSITQGTGQFCTSPGVILMLDSPQAQSFGIQLANAVTSIPLHPMLSAHIQEGFVRGVHTLQCHPDVHRLTPAMPTSTAVSAYVGSTTASAFLEHAALRHEVFGPACLIVLASTVEQVVEVLERIQGALTMTLWGADTDTPTHRVLIQAGQKIAGRILFQGVPTGVAVAQAQHHGGPWPTTTQPLFTSVGFKATDRFLRPVTLQDAPDWIQKRGGVPI